MNYKLFIILLSLISSTLYSQTLKITVVDKKSNETLPFVTLYLKNQGVGTTTDLTGSAHLKLNRNGSSNDTLICSYVGYKRQEIPILIKENIELNIKLETSSTELEEVVISAKRQLTVKQILKRIIKNTATNYSNKPANLNGFYRETIKENGKYIQLNEAVVDVFYTGYPQKKFDNRIWKDWFYDTSYEFEFEGSFFNELVHHFNTKGEQAKILKARSSNHLSEVGKEFSTSGGVLRLTALDLVKYQYDFLYPKNFSKYNYSLIGKESINGNICYKIQFQPNETNKKMVFDMGKKLGRSIYVGQMFVEVESFAIVKMEYQLANNVDYGYYSPKMPLDYQVKTSYQKKNGKWFLQNVKLKQVKKSDYLLISTQEFTVTNIETDSVKRLEEKDNWRHTRFTTLRYRKHFYDSIFWSSYQLSEDYPPLATKIKQDLEFDEPLEEQFKARFKQKENMLAPKAEKIDFTFYYPSDTIQDEYQWFAKEESKETFHKYLKEENKFAKNHSIPLDNYKRTFYGELNNFYVEDTTKAIYKKGEYVFSRDSVEDFIYCLVIDSVNKKDIFNVSKFSKNRKNFRFKNISNTESEQFASMLYEANGGLTNSVVVIDLINSRIVDSLENVNNIEWFNDTILLYTKFNEIQLSDKLLSRNIKTQKDSLLYLETDLTFDVEIDKTTEHIVCKLASNSENELWLIDKSKMNPVLHLLQTRKDEVTSTIKEYNNELYLLTNEGAPNNKLYKIVDKLDLSKREEIVPEQKKGIIQDFVITEQFIVISIYNNSLPEILYRLKSEKKWKKITFQQEVFFADLYPSKVKDQIKINYTSPNTPRVSFTCDLNSGNLTEIERVKTKPVYEHYYRYFKTERLWAKAADGTKVPITLTSMPYKKSKGVILKAYGAYGGGTAFGSYFSMDDAVLLNEGFTIAYAHVRGGGILGSSWYNEGRLLNKQNSFTDFISCAEYLIKKKYCTPQNLIASGNSAGGLTVAAAINIKPQLFNTVILDHPYLDVLITMMDDSLPLTTSEYKEWGNPNDKTIYEYIESYSPYQNIKSQNYPNVIVTASSNDFQTPAWQVAKYVAKLREYNTSSSSILFLTDFGSGHIGSTIGKEWVKDFAFRYAFVVDNLLK